MTGQPCPTCGTETAAGAEFCRNPQCGTFLGWDVAASATTQPQPAANQAVNHVNHHYQAAAPHHGHYANQGYAVPYAIQAQQPAMRPAARPKRDSPSLRVEIADPALAVEPGQSVATTVTVHNLGHQVEELAISVVGPAAAFSAVDPPTLKIYPATATTCALRFAPPRSPSCPAGTIGYGVQASSRLNSSVAAGESGTIVVGAYNDLTAELAPEATRSRLRSVHHVTLVNNGNSVQRVHLAAADRESALRFELPSSAIDVPPGRIAVPVRVRGRAALIGSGTRHPFDVAVTSVDGATLTRTSGTRITPAWLPAWLLAAVAVLGLLGASMVTLAKLRPASGDAKPPPAAVAPASEEPPADPTGGPADPPPSEQPIPSVTAGGAPPSSAGAQPPASPQLTFAASPLAKDVDLTKEGTAFWVQWGHRTSDDTNPARIVTAPAAEDCNDGKCATRKNDAAAQISTFELVGSTPATRFRDKEARKFSWDDGDPVLNADAQGCITVAGLNNGFTLTVSADNKQRTLRLYVSVKQARAQLNARLSDGSANPVNNTSIVSEDKGVNKIFVIEIKYRSKAANQTLNISYVMQNDSGGGTVGLHAATLK
jgi:hypothetical protein